MSYNKKRFCSSECEAVYDLSGGICNHCKYYDFNGGNSGAYIGNGFCNLHNVSSDPHEGCDGFTCFRVESE
ncbi:hypothetical protein GCM10023310_69390 [Paenibacillus vulneris]